MAAKATMNMGINQMALSETLPAMQLVVMIPTTRPTQPPTRSDFSRSIIPCVISANGTVTTANMSIVIQLSTPPMSRNPRHNAVAIIKLTPTVVHICDVKLSQ